MFLIIGANGPPLLIIYSFIDITGLVLNKACLHSALPPCSISCVRTSNSEYTQSLGVASQFPAPASTSKERHVHLYLALQLNVRFLPFVHNLILATNGQLAPIVMLYHKTILS